MGFQIIDALPTGRVEGEVDFPIAADLGDVSLEEFAGGEGAENLVGKKHAGVSAVDDRLIAEIGFGINHEINFLSGCVVGRGLVEVAVEAAAGDDAVAFCVNIDIDYVGFANIEALVLLAKWDEEVFGKSPVEERADGSDSDASQAGKLAGHHFGVFHGCDGAVFGVAVDKNIHGVAGFDFADGFVAREEDFPEFSAGLEKEPGGAFPQDS